jgi:hypothetical protein
MNKENRYSEYYQKYRDFWQNNLQIIEEISSSLENSLSSLEKKYSDLDYVYNDLIEKINVLSSIYSNYNNLPGLDYLLKLKSMLKEYKKRYSHDGVNFNVLYFLKSRIIELREKSFEEYPKLSHKKSPLPVKVLSAPDSSMPRDARFKWITFERNNSCFVVPYDEQSVLQYCEVEIVMEKKSSYLKIKINDTLIPVNDLFSSTMEEPNQKPVHFIVIRHKNGVHCFAADKVGKKIMCGKDIISHGLKPSHKSSFACGHIRLFGNRHLYINPDMLSL